MAVRPPTFEGSLNSGGEEEKGTEGIKEEDFDWAAWDKMKCPHRTDINDIKILGLFTAEVLPGWKNVDRSKIEIVDKSGYGGSRTLKISCEGADPSVIAYHCRRGDASADPISEKRTEIASKLLADNGVGPKRLAEGENWFIE